MSRRYKHFIFFKNARNLTWTISINAQVAFSTVNRWEGGNAKPNLIAMKNIKKFCLKNDVDYTGVEEAWLDFKVEGKSK